ncbi:MAG: prepilin-type N-terminal cleavage/methylation domain-containing protein [Planctomycetia bacterium]|nr:prepilin-type N-terminal cleavage/methylation domain-containing protein [Planctomycetia bacterium]
MRSAVIMRSNAILRPQRRGFTLIELLVVLLIMGIIAAVAMPKMLNTMSSTRANSARECLQIVRQAIEMYRSNDPNNAYPPAATLATALQPHLRGPFPTCPMGNLNASVYASTANPLVVSGTTDGWLYNQSTGDFAINDATGIAY